LLNEAATAEKLSPNTLVHLYNLTTTNNLVYLHDLTNGDNDEYALEQSLKPT